MNDMYGYSYNDFIFALIAEELGLLFTLVIIILFTIIFFRIIRLANISYDNSISNLSLIHYTSILFA